VFGSVARDAPDDASDLDLLVDLEPGRTMLDLLALERDLVALLGCRVDIGTPSARPSRAGSRMRSPNSEFRGHT
jgi:predicted nucleotidyltransferase